MDKSLYQIEYRGYSTYDIDSLVNSGQAHALGYGQGREGAYGWIDNKIDNLKLDNYKHPGAIRYYPKPDPAVRDRLIDQNNALHAVRKARDDAEMARRAKWDADH